MDEGGCRCWQIKSDLMPAESAGMGSTVRQRWISCESTHTHTNRPTEREGEWCSGVLSCKVSYVVEATFQVFVLDG